MQNLKIGSLRHVALCVYPLEACVAFYTKILGLKIDWQPDDDNVYLSSGTDNFALHRVAEELPETQQRLDHIGFVLESAEEVDRWFAFMKEQQVEIKAEPKTHRDGSRSFYCYDPARNVVQMIFMPGT